MGRGRERAVFWAAAALLVAGAGVAYRLLLGPEPGRAPATTAAPPAVQVRLAIAHVTGDVTVVRGGVRMPATDGAELRPDDALETAPGARVALAGGSYEVTLEEGGRFDVQEITAELSRFRLASGLVSASVQEEPGRAVEIQAGPDAAARTKGGRMAVARSGDVVAVGVDRGTAEFTSAGGAVVLHPGEQSTAAAGKRPSPPAPIPSSLLLKVTWPEERATNQRRIVVTGRTVPGAVVVLGDERVTVQPDGRFTHVVVLREGRQRLSARAHAVGGSASADGPTILLDTRAPDARFDTRDLWKQHGE
jgi:hypothetical protein